jgi:hypothetical protein
MSINPNVSSTVRYEMRKTQGIDPNVREQHRPGGFARFLSGIGKILGAVAAPLSFIFPPAAIGAAGMYGLGQLGDQMQVKSQQRAMEKAQREQPQPMAFPGLEVEGMGPQPASFDMGSRDRQVMQVLDARGAALNSMAQKI